MTIEGFALGPLLKARTPADVDRIIDSLGTRVEWVPLGRNQDNFGIVRMGSDPFDGLTERVTNAMDAMIEMEVELNPKLRSSSTPRQAIEAIYGFKDGNLRNCPEERIGDLATNIRVRFFDGSEAKRPTVEIIDTGIGQHPFDFPDTLLGLNRGYKISKFYLIGAFGQGGQTSFAHSEYGVVISRKHPRLVLDGRKDLVGWSIVRYRDPSTPTEMFKQGRWEYCVDAQTREVPTIDPRDLPIAFSHGTIIRLINYNLPKGSSDVLQPASTAWGYLSQSLFDAVLPIRLYEARERYVDEERKKEKNRPLSGLARRLWGGGKGEKVRISLNDTYRLDLGLPGSVTINYWAMTPANELENWWDVKKGYVSGSSAVFVTLNGQRHSVESTTFLRDLVGLTYSHNYVIVQVDCDGLTKEAKKNLFSTTRDRLIESEFTESLLNEIVTHLRQDRNLLQFEKNRKERIISAKSEMDTTKIRRMVGQYILQNPELRQLVDTRSSEKGEGEKQPHRGKEDSEEVSEEEIREDELVPPEFHEVPTFLKITNFKDPIPVEKGGSALVRLETDAMDGYFSDDWDTHFRGSHSADLTKRKSSSGLRSGKISYHIHCPQTVRVGSKERLRFELDVPNGLPLSAEREVICVHPFERKTESAKQKLPEPNIKPISEKENPAIWQQWGWNEESVGRIFIGKPDESGIFVSVDNLHLKAVLRKKGVETEIAEAIKNRYLAGVAYYLLVKKAQEMKGVIQKTVDEPGDSSPELDRLARTLAAVAIPSEHLT
jgi:hypothetical protein